MKAILEFDLPEEHSEFEDATRGWEYHSVLHDFDQRLRRMIKDGETTTLQGVRDLLHECLDGLDLYD